MNFDKSINNYLINESENNPYHGNNDTSDFATNNEFNE